jgi:hypothetical protein
MDCKKIKKDISTAEQAIVEDVLLRKIQLWDKKRYVVKMPHLNQNVRQPNKLFGNFRNESKTKRDLVQNNMRSKEV